VLLSIALRHPSSGASAAGLPYGRLTCCEHKGVATHLLLGQLRVLPRGFGSKAVVLLVFVRSRFGVGGNNLGWRSWEAIRIRPCAAAG
jgi:hypothetical protein